MIPAERDSFRFFLGIRIVKITIKIFIKVLRLPQEPRGPKPPPAEARHSGRPPQSSTRKTRCGNRSRPCSPPAARRKRALRASCSPPRGAAANCRHRQAMPNFQPKNGHKQRAAAFDPHSSPHDLASPSPRPSLPPPEEEYNSINMQAAARSRAGGEAKKPPPKKEPRIYLVVPYF